MKLLFQRVSRKFVRGISIFLICWSSYSYAQVPIDKFWILNQSPSTLIWDNVGWNNQIDNGSGSWNTTNWTTNGGKSNINWIACKDAVFGGNLSVGIAGTVTLTTAVSAKGLYFKPVPGGNFTLTGQSIASCFSPMTIGTEIDATIVSALTGINQILKTGTGILTLSGNNTYSSNMIIREGEVIANSNAALGATTNVITMGDVNSPVGAVTNLTIGPSVTSTIRLTSINTTNFSTPTINLNAGTGIGINRTVLACNINLAGDKALTIVATNTSHGGPEDWNGAINGSGIATGSTALTLDGSGKQLRLTFGGPSGTGTTPNTFTGDVIMKGYVQTQNTIYAGATAAHQNMGFQNNIINVTTGATWVIQQGSETVEGLNGVGVVTLGSNLGALNNIALIIGNHNGGGAFSGTMNGGYGISKIGTGTQILEGAGINYAAATVLDGGILELKNTTGWRSSNIAAAIGTVLKKTGTGSTLYVGWNGGQTYMQMAAGSTLDVQEGIVSNNYTRNPWVNNKGSVNIASGATLDLFADPIYLDALSGSGTITNGFTSGGVKTLFIGVSNTINNAAYGVSGNATVFSGIINNLGGNVAVEKQGSGTQIFAGNNTYTGGTTINGGTLTAGNVNAFGTGTIMVNAGATLNKNGFEIANVIVNNGGVVIP